MPLNPARAHALLFDVFGTCVDWRSTVTTALHDQARTTLNDPTASLATAVRLRATDLTFDDWGRFAQEWRNEYMKFTRGLAKALQEAEKPGGPPSSPAAFKSVDQHHLDSLKELLQRWRLDGLWTPAQVQRLSLVWHHLAPWPDAPAGVEGLNAIPLPGGAAGGDGEGEARLTTATLSNGNTALLLDLTAHARLPFTRVFSAEDFAAYKPHPKVYLGAVERLGLRPEECVLVAAHLGDLRAAAACGLGTVYVARPREEDWSVEEVKRAREEGWVGLWVEEGEGGFGRVAEALRQGA
ncbi:HAD-superfamily hydrolase subfamily IA variant 2 [Neofusicoccum parvum]|uniref:HAD-superfamily hydrolase subfamily IA variant 2 n=1 Tax=Neofusicoccum parvum TaxID=310453 RepID=A0ACB5RV23_9PEZI|nr:HAD-superfamily hydrolase subfamily IA variant 2 [Neofusicoccum parvum]